VNKACSLRLCARLFALHLIITDAGIINNSRFERWFSLLPVLATCRVHVPVPRYTTTYLHVGTYYVGLVEAMHEGLRVL